MQQLNLELANMRADLGVERAARKAERIGGDWIERALREVGFFARGVPADAAEFTIEEARAFAEALQPRPSSVDGRVWGHITREACARGLIERVPGKFKAAASSNGSPKAVYRRGPKA